MALRKLARACERKRAASVRLVAAWAPSRAAVQGLPLGRLRGVKGAKP
jgi:hypothetical protein